MPDPELRWVGTCTSRWAVPLVAVIAVVALGSIAATVGSSPGGAIAPAIGLAVATPTLLAFRRIDVSVRDDAVLVRYAIPHTRRIPIAEIEGVEVIDDLRPARWGGWGYRGGLAVLRQAAIVLRRGPALLLELRGGRRLAITVDDAAIGADAIRSLLRVS